MILPALAFLGGALTILSPCTLPVIPFIFARNDRPFVRSTLPLLLGMALTFAAVATLAAIGGSWAVRLNAYGRDLALLVLGVFAVALLSTHVAEWLARPAVALGNRLMRSGTAGSGAGEVAPSLLLGVATGLLWAPCAGPVLGLILTGAAIHGPSAGTTLLLLAYALGAAASMTIVTLAGRRVLMALKHSLGIGVWLRRGLGVLVLAAVTVIALGWDTSILTQLSVAGTNRLEQSLIGAFGAPAAGGTGSGAMMSMKAAKGGAMMAAAGAGAGPAAEAAALPIEGKLPALGGALEWINSAPLSSESLRGKVVLVDFWTYSCINCLRTLPYIKDWYQRYKDHGLVIIGVHSPEFAFERDPANVRRAVRELGITYPVAVDSHLTIWQAFNNEYWPADYFIDAEGRIRAHQFGEGDYAGAEHLIRLLLEQAGHTDLPPASAAVQGQGIEAPGDLGEVASPETYIGYARGQNFASPEPVAADKVTHYEIPATLQLNQWALAGPWQIDGESATLQAAPGRIAFRFRARDLHLVLGPDADGKPVRFEVRIDGAPPGADHGVDTDAQGAGVVREQRLYQLIRQSGAVGEHTFSIEFLDPGVHAYSFTFG
jgi:cytochrome c biogenesis protein CcdA/thiol-disulfide isomerase/thioredoxin